VTRTRRALLFAGVGVVLVVVGVVVATGVLFLWPSTDSPQHADAVVVFGGKHSERLARGLDLIQQGYASTLVVSDPPEGFACRDTREARVVCIHPQPTNTRAEARAVGGLAASRGWTHLILVTSSYHVSRARLLLGRCYTGDLDTVAAHADEGVGRTVDRLTHEWGGLIYAWTIARAC
jgi:uncharacterized SAM-binding protein YcdF (DUF218 family)